MTSAHRESPFFISSIAHLRITELSTVIFRVFFSTYFAFSVTMMCVYVYVVCDVCLICMSMTECVFVCLLGCVCVCVCVCVYVCVCLLVSGVCVCVCLLVCGVCVCVCVYVCWYVVCVCMSVGMWCVCVCVCVCLLVCGVCVCVCVCMCVGMWCVCMCVCVYVCWYVVCVYVCVYVFMCAYKCKHVLAHTYLGFPQCLWRSEDWCCHPLPSTLHPLKEGFFFVTNYICQAHWLRFLPMLLALFDFSLNVGALGKQLPAPTKASCGFQGFGIRLSNWHSQAWLIEQSPQPCAKLVFRWGYESFEHQRIPFQKLVGFFLLFSLMGIF